MTAVPFIVGLGGTTRPGSTSEREERREAVMEEPRARELEEERGRLLELEGGGRKGEM